MGFVEGHGTTTQGQAYRYTSHSLRVGEHKFRLAQVDTDGTKHLSTPRQIDVSSQGEIVLKGGNPVQSGATVRVAVRTETEQSIAVSVYDVTGRRVAVLGQKTVHPSRPFRTSLSTVQIGSGKYFIRATGRSFDQTKRMTVVR